jgi:hypothetical protein
MKTSSQPVISFLALSLLTFASVSVSVAGPREKGSELNSPLCQGGTTDLQRSGGYLFTDYVLRCDNDTHLHIYREELRPDHSTTGRLILHESVDLNSPKAQFLKSGAGHYAKDSIIERYYYTQTSSYCGGRLELNVALLQRARELYMTKPLGLCVDFDMKTEISTNQAYVADTRNSINDQYKESDLVVVQPNVYGFQFLILAVDSTAALENFDLRKAEISLESKLPWRYLRNNPMSITPNPNCGYMPLQAKFLYSSDKFYAGFVGADIRTYDFSDRNNVLEKVLFKINGEQTCYATYFSFARGKADDGDLLGGHVYLMPNRKIHFLHESRPDDSPPKIDYYEFSY